MDTKIIQAFEDGKPEEAVEMATNNDFSIGVLNFLADNEHFFEHLWTFYQLAVAKGMNLGPFILDNVVLNGRVDLADFLFVQKGLDPNIRYGTMEQTALMMACRYNHRDIVERLLTLDTIDPDQQDNWDRKAISYLGPSTDVNIFHSLFIQTKQLDTVDRLGKNILHKLCCHIEEGNEVFEQILNVGVLDINFPDTFGRTPLHHCVICFLKGRWAIKDRMMALINHPNIDFTIKDRFGKSILDLCSKSNSPNVQFILDAIAAVQQK